MTEEIEIEFKTLLGEGDFLKLLNHLPFPSQPTEQTNYYFDTDNMILKQHASALRIREKNGSYTLTLKQPHEKGILETHDSLTNKEYKAWIQGNPIVKPHNAKKFAQIGIETKELIYYGFLRTKRHAFKEDGLEFVLDASDYLGRHDYELEIEADHYESGLEAFEKVLAQYDIQKKPPVTKIERFFNTLKI